MKKLFLFLAILFIAVSVDAQVKGKSLQINGGTKLTGDRDATLDFYTETEINTLLSSRAVVLLKDNTQHSLSNTNVATTVYTGTIPANTLAANGKLVFENLLSFTGSTNAKTVRVKINGTDVGYFSTSTAANLNAQNTYRLWLRSGNAQIGMNAASNASGGFTVGTLALTSYSFNYTQDWTITVAITMASSAETTSLESFSVVYYP